MNLPLTPTSDKLSGEIRITGSKSESNRLLILRALYPEIEIDNLSNSDDTKLLELALTSSESTKDIHHAGTAMRFLTAYYATRQGQQVTLTGSQRMQERPVELLVDALRSLGAEIDYLKNEGYPPLRIRGRKLQGDRVRLTANISSQYITALMLIAPTLPNGLEIELLGLITSIPYLKMTLSQMQAAGFQGSFEGNLIKIAAQDKIKPVKLTVESDWSSVSYFYSLAALSETADLRLSSYGRESLQGDAVLAKLYHELGVETTFKDDEIVLKRRPCRRPRSVEFHLVDSPDIAQTIAVTCLGLGIRCKMTGLHTLKIKETDRLFALKTELERLGAKVEITHDSLLMIPTDQILENVLIRTYNDHRMAMAFAPLVMKVPIVIEDSEVVTKSYPQFWEDLERVL